jgi:zinc protease
MRHAHTRPSPERLDKSRALLLIVLFEMLALQVASPSLGSAEEDVLRATLPNGLRVVAVRNSLAPVVATFVTYLVGANETPEGFPGMAHAQEHMMFRGSPGLSAAQISRIAAALGGSFNADTKQTVTQYFFTVGTCHRRAEPRGDARDPSR